MNDTMHIEISDISKRAMTNAADRIDELQTKNAKLRGQIVVLVVACRSLLHHCDPDAPLVDGIGRAREHAKKVIRNMMADADSY